MSLFDNLSSLSIKKIGKLIASKSAPLPAIAVTGGLSNAALRESGIFRVGIPYTLPRFPRRHSKNLRPGK